MFERRIRNHGGFTLTEVLVTVSITIVLLAVSIVSVAKYVNQLKITELDNTAREIFMAAQNRAVTLKSNGKLDELVVEEDGSNELAGVVFGEGSGQVLASLHWANSEDEHIRTLISWDEIRTAAGEGFFYIVYEAASGSVTDVFFAKEKFSEPESFADFYHTYRGADQEVREKSAPMIGYYGGDFADGKNAASLRTPVINIHNENVLWAEVSWWIPRTLSEEVRDDMRMEITFQYGSSGGQYLIRKGQNSLTTAPVRDTKFDGRCEEVKEEGIAYIQYTDVIVLDVLQNEARTTGKQFLNFASGTKGIGGGNFTINAELSYIGSELNINPVSASESDNGLFAKDSDSEGARIRCLRHLQNLHTAYSGAKYPYIKKAIQEEDIDCAGWYVEDEGIFRTLVKLGVIDGGKRFIPHNFFPINSEIEGYDGQNYRIKNLYISKKDGYGTGIYSTWSANAGLFAEAPRVLSNVRIVNAVVKTDIFKTDDKGVKADYAGSLAGVLPAGAEVTNCQSYWEPGAGGQPKLSSLLIDQDGQYQYQVCQLSDSDAVAAGGLIGLAEAGSTISNSFAATLVKGSVVGGLVGEGKDVAIDHCYADCYLEGETVGGLVGNLTGDDNSVEVCYTTGFISSVGTNSVAAGLCGGTGTATVKKSYTAMTYGDHEGTKYYPLCVDSTGIAQETVHYLKHKNLPDEGELVVQYDALKDPGQLEILFGNNSGFEMKSFASSHPYNLQEGRALDTYPFPGIAAVEAESQPMDHYGDWSGEFKDVSLVYYEQYAEDEGMSVYGFEGGGVGCLQDRPAEKDGYAVALKDLPNDEAGFSIQYTYLNEQGTESITITQKYGETAEDSALSLMKVETEEETYYLAPLPSELVHTAYASSEFYQTLKFRIGEEPEAKAYYYNPHFACTAVEQGQVQSGADPEQPQPDFGAVTARIRTPRHLYELSRHAAYYTDGTLTFSQEMDLDYAFYRDYGQTDVQGICQSAIGTMEQPFAGAYYGGCHRIENLPADTGITCAGLFGKNDGEIHDVVYLQSKETQKYENNAMTYGGLVGYNAGIIDNSAAADVNVSITGGGRICAGGLVGINEGTITNSSAAVNRLEILGSLDVSAGGFVGENQAAGEIENAYAVGRLKTGQAAEGTVSGFAGRNQGRISRCYAAADLDTDEGVQTFGFSSGESENSYYLNQGNFVFDETWYRAQYEDAKNGASGQNWMRLTDQDASRLPGSGFGYEEGEDAFPLPAVVKNAEDQYIHYGSWPEYQELGMAGVYYWEREASTYRFCVLSIDMDQNLLTEQSGLCQERDDAWEIEAYGYGYFYKPVKGSRISEDLTGISQENENASVQDALWTCLGLDTGYTAVSCRAGEDLGADSDHQNGVVKITMPTGVSAAFYMNPLFGRALAFGGVRDRQDRDLQWYVPGSDQEMLSGEVFEIPGSSADSAYEVRCADQLANINSRSAYMESGLFWKQSHDVAGKIVPPNPDDPAGAVVREAMQPIGSKENSFQGTYDGDGYVIRDWKVDGTGQQYIGLFGAVSGAELKNIVLYSAGETITVDHADDSKEYAAGVLAGLVRGGSITNCAAAGYQVIDESTRGSGSVGGLIGLGEDGLTVDRCSAAVTLVLNHRQQVLAGGLAGSCDGSITNCYTGGNIGYGELEEPEESTFEDLSISGVSLLSEEDSQMKNCYSYTVLPEKRDGVELYAVGAGEGIQNCYYLKGAAWKNNMDSQTGEALAVEASQALTFAQMAGEDPVEAGTDRLFPDVLGEAFGTVTVSDNPDQGEMGQYSYEISEELRGLDYRFPTVLTRSLSQDQTVNVHYGDWFMEEPELLGGITRAEGGPVEIDLTGKDHSREIPLTISEGLSSVYPNGGLEASCQNRAVRAEEQSPDQEASGIWQVELIDSETAENQEPVVTAEITEGSTLTITGQRVGWAEVTVSYLRDLREDDTAAAVLHIPVVVTGEVGLAPSSDGVPSSEVQIRQGQEAEISMIADEEEPLLRDSSVEVIPLELFGKDNTPLSQALREEIEDLEVYASETGEANLIEEAGYDKDSGCLWVRFAKQKEPLPEGYRTSLTLEYTYRLRGGTYAGSVRFGIIYEPSEETGPDAEDPDTGPEPPEALVSDEAQEGEEAGASPSEEAEDQTPLVSEEPEDGTEERPLVDAGSSAEAEAETKDKDAPDDSAQEPEDGILPEPPVNEPVPDQEEESKPEQKEETDARTEDETKEDESSQSQEEEP